MLNAAESMESEEQGMFFKKKLKKNHESITLFSLMKENKIERNYLHNPTILNIPLVPSMIPCRTNTKWPLDLET